MFQYEIPCNKTTCKLSQIDPLGMGSYALCNNIIFLAVEDYKSISELMNKTVGYQLCPSYYAISKYRPLLRPAGMEPVNEAGTEAPCAMQPLLEHTVSRTLAIPKYRKKVLETEVKSREAKKPLQYICYAKIGVDGYTGTFVFFCICLYKHLG